MLSTTGPTKKSPAMAPKAPNFGASRRTAPNCSAFETRSTLTSCMVMPLDISIDGRKIGTVFACNIILILPLSASLLFGSSALSIISGLVILAVAYPALVVIFGLIGNRELEMAKAIYKRMPMIKKPAQLISKYVAFLISMKEAVS